MPRSGVRRLPLTPLGFTALISLAACSSNPSTAETASPVATALGVGISMTAPAYAGVPTRSVVTVAPARADAHVSVIDAAGSPLASASTDARGRAYLSWTWPGAAEHQVHAVVADESTATATTTSDTIDVESLDAERDAPSARAEPTRADDNVSLVSAAGQSQWLDCRGEGGPTTVLIAGLDGWSRDWDPMLAQLRAEGRVCSYDRPGLGSSPGRAGELEVDASLHAAELRQLLAAADESGPFLIVGHSYGGLIARAFDDADPTSTAGMVLLDPVPAFFHHVDPQYDAQFTEASPTTVIDLERSGEATGGTAALAGLPLIVLAAGEPQSWTTAEEWRLWQVAQRETAAASENSLFLVADGATHQLQSTATQLSVAAVAELRSSLREHRVVGLTSELSAAAGR